VCAGVLLLSWIHYGQSPIPMPFVTKNWVDNEANHNLNDCYRGDDRGANANLSNTPCYND
jgi:hypothetical protein